MNFMWKTDRHILMSFMHLRLRCICSEKVDIMTMIVNLCLSFDIWLEDKRANKLPETILVREA